MEVLCAKAAVPIKDMVGSTMTVHMNFRSGGKRHFNGYVTDFSLRGVIGDRFVFAATLRPWLHMLSLRVNCCIHKGSAIEIVKGVCSKYSSLGNLKPDIAPPDGGVQPPVYEFVVQYRETDLSFVSRILEREGLYYYFTHDEAKHEMVVTNVARLSVKGYEEIVYQPASTDNEAVPEAMEDWRPHFSYTPDKFKTNDFDFEKPKISSLLVAREIEAQHVNHAIEVYDYPGGYLDVGLGDELAKRRLLTLQVPGARFEGETNARGVTAGQLFKLTKHAQDGLNIEYFVYSARFRILSHALQSSAAIEAHGDVMRASIVALDALAPFFPPLTTPKPRMSGVQTAIVVGGAKPAQDKKPDPGSAPPPPPEEIDIDEWGRVKVRFHWDPDPDETGQNSCRVRVSQAWAGMNLGAYFHPRIGQEVIVDFIDGDPDQPIIVGRVHGFENQPPYPSPTLSGIKTHSTPNGEATNFNEIRFEDKKGSEELFFQAEKTQTTKVKGSQSISVGGDRSVSVTGLEDYKIEKTRTVTVKGKVEDIYKATHTVTVAEAQSMSAKSQDFSAPDGIVLTQAAEAGAATGTWQGGNVSLSAQHRMELSATNEKVQIFCGETMVVVTKDAVTVTGKQKVKMHVGDGTVIELTSSGASVKSPKVDVESSGLVSITGTQVNLNP